MSYLSKQRIERILNRCFNQHQTGMEQNAPELFNIDLNVTMVRCDNGKSSMHLRRKEIVNRILCDFEKKNLLQASESAQCIELESKK